VLDLEAFGHSSPLVAATTLLWDVLRIVNREDTDNPVVGVEDAVALTPRPGLLGCWPSLYQALCEIVLSNGAAESAPPGEAGEHDVIAKTSSVLLSQVRPLLERHWHASFDESGLGFLNEEGTFVRLKKLKHLLHSVLRWREQRQAWQRSAQSKPTEVDEVLKPTLVLVASNKHNDLLLRCSVGTEDNVESPPALRGETSPVPRHPPQTFETFDVDEQPLEVPTPEKEPVERTPQRKPSVEASQLSSCKLQRELDRLRAENQELRAKNKALELFGNKPAIGSSTTESPPPSTPTGQSVTPQLPADIFDDPFEPPPEARFWNALDSCKASTDYGSVDARSELSFGTSSVMSGTPRCFGLHSGCGSEVASGAMTPVQTSVAQQGCTFVPMWFSLMHSGFGDIGVSVIPRGIVQTARAHFERLGGR